MIEVEKAYFKAVDFYFHARWIILAELHAIYSLSGANRNSERIGYTVPEGARCRMESRPSVLPFSPPVAAPALAHAKYRSDIQGLRGIAVLLVVAYHAGLPFLQGGYIGVDVFFVVSGYLITGLLFDELKASQSIDLLGFYARRIRRLLPAATLVLLSILVLGWVLYTPLERREFSASAVAASLYLSNVWFARHSTDYLAADADSNLILHTWSLAVEEQFYLIWPCVLLLATKAGSVATARRRLLAVVALASLLSLVAGVVVTWKSQPWAFFSSPTRAWEFGVGALAYLLPWDRLALKRRALNLVGFAGLSAIGAGAVVFSEDTLFPGIVALLPVCGTAASIIASSGAVRSNVYTLLSARPLTWLGDLSYSWYLWHWPALAMPELLLGYRDPVLCGVGAAASLGLAFGTYVLVENPIRYSRFLSPRTGASVLLGLVLSATSAAAFYAAYSSSGRDMLAADQSLYAKARDDIPRVYAAGCHARFEQVSMPECLFGNAQAKGTVVLWGDSHAAQWFPALESLAQDQGWALASFTKSSCPSIRVEPFLDKYRRSYFECTEWHQQILDRIAALKPEVVVLANAGNYVDERGPIDVEAWLAGLNRVLEVLERAGIPVLFIRDTPWPGFDVPTCLARAAWRGKDMETACRFDLRASLRNATLFERENAAIARHRRADTLDLSPVICPTESCNAMRDGVVVYSDSHHLTATFSRSLAGAILSATLDLVQEAR